MNMRQAIVAALKRDPGIVPKLTDSLRNRIEEEQGTMATVVQAAEALEPVIAEAVEKRPSRLAKLGLKSAHLLASLVAEDQRSNKVLANIAGNGTVGIAFVDVAGFLAYTAEEGDEAAIRFITRLEALVRRCAKRCKGECVKSLGDGFLLAFPSASQAVRGARAIMEAVSRERSSDGRFPLEVRIAVHAGEPLIEQDDLLGLDVNLTARLLDFCRPGEVIVSGAAKELSQRRLKKIDFSNERTLKVRGLATPIIAYSVADSPAPSSG
jgi:class 3 adenylate cyclase